MPSLLTTPLDAARRQKKRWFGTGPWYAQPFADLLAHRHPPGAWHAPETVDGEIAAIPYSATAFTRGCSLLGQESRPFVTESGEPRYCEGGIAPAHTTRFWSLDAAGVLGDDGLVYCPRFRAAVAESARTIFRSEGNHSALRYARPITARLEGVSLLLAGPFGHAHYHVLWDLLAKLALFPDALRRSVDYILLGAPQTPTTLDWLRAAAVPVDRIVWLKAENHWLATKLFSACCPRW